MSGSIPRPFIDDLLNRVDIVEIIDARVPLKKKGREYWACCPFHNEKSPSFSVSQNKQFYHCFGCQQHGNAISFLMDYDHMEFVEAVEALAQNLGVEVPYEKHHNAQTSQQKQRAETLTEAMHKCSEYFQNQLKTNQNAINYLKNRGISDQTAKLYGIGYAPEGWNNLQQSLSCKPEHLLESGMLVQKDDGNSYDRFRHRLMFPIRDRRGNTIAFGGRVINPDDNPKYLNSPESPVFHKGEEIYGLHELKQGNTQIEQIFVTEGYMDVVALAEHGISTAVATLGTAINQSQIEKLFRLCKNIVFCFDGDTAGKKAAWRALENCISTLKENRMARFLFLPDGHDPDTFIKEFGQQAFLQQSSQASTLTEYLLNQLLSQHQVQNPEGRAAFYNQLESFFKKIPLQSLKDELLLKAEKHPMIKLDPRQVQQIQHHNRTHSSNNILPEQHWTPVRLAINLLLQQPSLASSAGNLEELAETDIPGIELLLQMLDQIHEQPDISSQNLLSRFTGHEHETHLYKIASMSPAINHDDEIQAMFDDAINRLRPKYNASRFEKLQRKLMAGQKLDEHELHEYRLLLKRDKK